MWQIKNIKKNGKIILKGNLSTLILIGIFMSLIIGRYIINNDAFSNLEILYEYVTDNDLQNISINDGKIIINKYLDKFLSQMTQGNMSGLINKYNEKHNVTKGVIYTVTNIITKGQSQIQNLMNSINNYDKEDTFTGIKVIVAALLGLIIRIMITYPILVGENRVFLESINYQNTKIKRIAYAFKKERYINSVLTLFCMELYKFLWNLTIVGGFIKNYSYKMVKYIIAENPNIKPNDAIKMSIEMMKGNKFQAFKLDVTFIPLNILQYITFGLAGIYVSPYYTATYTELYRILREEYINNKKINYELLNDDQLFEKSELSIYPDKYEKQKKKIKINYEKKYEITSIILLFFIFSFVGWIWEVFLYLFRDGILINRGAMYGPWLPIYGFGCTSIILLTRFESFRKMLKNPVLTFEIIVILCSIIEYVTSWAIEYFTGLKYWDYTGVFLNLNGRICLECSLFFGLGGALCVYIVAPFLESKIQKITMKTKIIICTILMFLLFCDNWYSILHPHEGEGITVQSYNEKIMQNS